MKSKRELPADERKLLAEFFELKQQLQKLRVLRSERITGDLGDGWSRLPTMASSLLVPLKKMGCSRRDQREISKIQVKTHAKAKTTMPDGLRLKRIPGTF